MAVSYNTTTSVITVTTPSTVRALYDNAQTTFAGSSFMQYLLPLQGNVKDSLYTLINAWVFAAGSVAFLNTGAIQDAAGNNIWDNVQTLGSISNGTLLYAAQGATVSYLSHTYTLNGALTLGATSVIVNGVIDVSEAASGYILVDSEVMNFTSWTGSTFTVVRGSVGTAAATHLTAAVVSITGHVNAELQVKSAGSLINSGSLTIYARKFQQTYSQFSTTGGAFISNIPLSTAADSNLTISNATLTAYSDLTVKWEAIYRSAFDGLTVTKYALNGALTNVATTVVVTPAIDASVAAAGRFQVDGEVFSYTSWAGSTFSGVTRGQYDTTAVSHLTGANLSTNMAQYSIKIGTTNAARATVEAYNWIQLQLLKTTDIDALTSGKLGYIQNALVGMSGPIMTTSQGVWIEGFRSADNNNVLYTDLAGVVHTPPITITVSITNDATITGGQVSVFALNTTGLTDATYTPANITSTLINQAAGGTITSLSLIYTVDTPVRVIVRKPGYQQYSAYLTITSTGLSASAQNPVDSAF